MSFPLSIFAVEVDGTPTIVFEAKWQAEADEILHGWAKLHEEISRKSSKQDWPAILKLRLAKSPEKQAYRAANDSFELYGEVKIVWLVEPPELQGAAQSDDVEPGTD